MGQKRRDLVVAVAAFAVTASLGLSALTRYSPPFPPMSATLSLPVARLSDFSGILMGLRRLAADIAWIQTLQYYGSHDAAGQKDEFEVENGGGEYYTFFDLCQRVARIDPYFTYAYYYGGGVLGWNLNRLSEAEALLKLGIANNRNEWRLPQYLAALAYQKDHDPKKLMAFLEGFVTAPDCPNLLRALLANLYKKQGRYREAIHTWQLIAATGEKDYLSRADHQINEILALEGQRRHP